MLVVPDANVLYSDPFLDGPLIRTILMSESLTGLKVAIPAVVVDELRNKVVERLNNLVKDAESVRRDCAALLGVSPLELGFLVTREQRQAILARFERRIEQFTREGRILEYPSVSTQDLAHRSIEVRAPFGPRDRGLRDTLIWINVKESLLNSLDVDQKVVLVTADGGFWNRNKDGLDDGLKGEVKDAGLPEDSVVLSRSLRSVVDTYVSGKLSDADWVRVAIEGGQVKDFTQSDDTVILTAHDWFYQNPDIFMDSYGNVIGSGLYVTVEFDVIEGVSLEQVNRTFDLGGGMVLVDSEWGCEVAAMGYRGAYTPDYVDVTLRFTLFSIVEVEKDGKLSVLEHRIGDMNVVGIQENVIRDNW